MVPSFMILLGKDGPIEILFGYSMSICICLWRGTCCFVASFLAASLDSSAVLRWAAISFLRAAVTNADWSKYSYTVTTIDKYIMHT